MSKVRSSAAAARDRSTIDVREVQVGSINPAPYNPRVDLRPGDPEYEKLARSIDEFGLVEPLVWNARTGHLVGGHQRFKVLLQRGVKSVQVSVVDLPIEKEKALNLALNKIAGGWDHEKLAELLNELVELPGFDLSLTGFDPRTLMNCWPARCCGRTRRVMNSSISTRRWRSPSGSARR